MKDKCFELLKENLLLQTAGGFSMFDKSIDLIIDIYCELSNINKETFLEKLNNIKMIAWEGYDCHKQFEKHQSTYEYLIDTLR